jgi:hypothetical protein
VDRARYWSVRIALRKQEVVVMSGIIYATWFHFLVDEEDHPNTCLFRSLSYTI